MSDIEIKEKLLKILQDQLGESTNKSTKKDSMVDIDTDFSKSLGFDSLDLVELVMRIEEEFGIEITDEEGESLKTMTQTVEMVKSKINV